MHLNCDVGYDAYFKATHTSPISQSGMQIFFRYLFQLKRLNLLIDSDSWNRETLIAYNERLLKVHPYIPTGLHSKSWPATGITQHAACFDMDPQLDLRSAKLAGAEQSDPWKWMQNNVGYSFISAKIHQITWLKRKLPTASDDPRENSIHEKEKPILWMLCHTYFKIDKIDGRKIT